MSKREPKRLKIVAETAEFREVFEAHYKSVLGWLSYLVGDAAAAEDLAQEVFIKLLYSPPGDQTNLGGWLNTVAANLAFNHLRSEKSRRIREEKVQSSSDTRHSAEDHVVEMAEVSWVEQALEQMEVRDLMCLLLKAAGFNYAEIGQVTGVKKSSVGSVLARARAKFKKICSELGRGGDEGVLPSGRTTSLP